MGSLQLFLKESSKTIKSIPYLIYVIIIFVFLTTQLIPGFIKIEKPQPGKQRYGIKYVENPDIIIPAAVKSLYREFTFNSYIAYPIGFYKNVKLSDAEKLEMASILTKLTGISEDKLIQSSGIKRSETIFKNGIDTVKNPLITDVTINEAVTYEEFLVLMNKADRIIGGGSKYSDLYISSFGAVPMTYEDALLEYNLVVEKDKITGAYARLFCDYLGIVLAICPVFVAVALGIKDRSSKIHELIYTRKISSVRIVSVRYLAMIGTMLIPVLLIALYLTGLVAKKYSGMEIDILAFEKYTFGWLLPTLMLSTAVGVILTELTDSPIAILVQGLWWFFGLFRGVRMMNGGYGWNLMPRHNVLGNTQVYLDNFNILMLNRIVYATLAMALVLLTVFIYERKRRGRFYAYGSIRKIFIHRSKKSEA